MKRLVFLLIALVLVFSLISCTKDEETKTGEAKTEAKTGVPDLNEFLKEQGIEKGYETPIIFGGN